MAKGKMGERVSEDAQLKLTDLVVDCGYKAGRGGGISWRQIRNPDPSLEGGCWGFPIPSEKNRNVGRITLSQDILYLDSKGFKAIFCKFSTMLYRHPNIFILRRCHVDPQKQPTNQAPFTSRDMTGWYWMSRDGKSPQDPKFGECTVKLCEPFENESTYSKTCVISPWSFLRQLG